VIRWLRLAAAGPMVFVAGGLLSFGTTRQVERVEYLRVAETLPAPEAQARPVRHEGVRRLKVLTYNLNHVSRGNDNDPQNDPYFPRGSSELRKLSISLPSLARDPGRVERHLQEMAALLRREDADIVLLQEADRGMAESLWVDAARELAQRAGYAHAVWAPKWTMRIGVPYVTGNAILSKHPIREARNVALNPLGWGVPHRKLFGAHTALEAVVDVGGQPLTVINTHLTSKRHNYPTKAEQVEALLARVAGSRHPVIVGGDLNTSVRRLRSDRPVSRDPTLPLLHASGLVDMQGVHDEDTLDYILLRQRDPTAYERMYKLPPVATDHYINVCVVALEQSASQLAMAR
jgi:endonuclease/exonuclease/phosphatase family metal-dependent hydrolase